MTLPARRTLIGAALLLAACQSQPARLPTGTALPPPRDAAAFEPAPTPNSQVETTPERRARALQTQPTPGPGRFPGFGTPSSIGSDQELAPIPANRMR
ncbi:hypothetical protein [Falsiroseomonas sp. HW251]|uniref:hypothetical protein n=1 Tax=Falsiroseomonas sp. HW251 TaxID=3390998 RepID=UPI003D315CF4